ncbi:FadR/GntR family transcriptional regulator [Sphingomonas tabacisoli]|uniref:FadR/GntR family transcriptional regulator n=1 Tax=Sphingomonas tabacisoli TaxID=2249466 RepID=A0ABW4I1X9_9SPHN
MTGTQSEPTPKRRKEKSGTRARKRSEQVALQIIEKIAQRGQQPGDKLPQEPEMLEEYDVSRSSLREGLRLLEVQGLITIRTGPGNGTEVGQIDPANLSRTLGLYLIMSRINLRQLLDAWLTVEPILARLAAECPDREKVERLIRPFATHGTHDDRNVESGLAFHDMVAEAANNPVLALILAAVGYLVTEQVRIFAPEFELTHATVHSHEVLADCILAGDGDQAAALMLAHLKDVVAELETILPSLDGDISLRS